VSDQPPARSPAAGSTPAADRWRLADRILYLCTPDRPDLAEFVAACLAGGVDLVQLRDKQLSDDQVVARARLLVDLAEPFGVPVIVNDRPDLAVAAGAAGCHVGQDDLPPVQARALLGPDRLLGRSTHRPAELEAGLEEPVDYLSAGPVEPTPTKPGRPGTGAAYAGWATRRSPLPVFVTGGVRPETVPALVAAGVRRFVVVRYLVEAPDPSQAARRLRTAIEAALGLQAP
jgi:thiamine-phosphate pyrophosphorylase